LPKAKALNNLDILYKATTIPKYNDTFAALKKLLIDIELII